MKKPFNINWFVRTKFLSWHQNNRAALQTILDSCFHSGCSIFWKTAAAEKKNYKSEESLFFSPPLHPSWFQWTLTWYIFFSSCKRSPLKPPCALLSTEDKWRPPEDCGPEGLWVISAAFQTEFWACSPTAAATCKTHLRKRHLSLF